MRAKPPPKNTQSVAFWTAMVLAAFLVVVLILVIESLNGSEPVTTTLKPTTTVKPTTTTKPTATEAEKQWLARLTAYRTQLDKVMAPPRAPTKPNLTRWIVTLRGCNLAQFGTPGPRLTLAAVQAQSGCDHAKQAVASFTTALKYVARKDAPGKAAFKQHVDAGLRSTGIARNFLVTAERTATAALA